MTKPLSMPELGRCPYCGRKLQLRYAHFPAFPDWEVHCWNADCVLNKGYQTERGAINAANRRVT